MNGKFLYLAVLIAGLMLVDLSVNQVYGQTPPAKQVKQQTVKYTCPMHPEVVMDKPGKCPKCGMTLVKKKEVKKEEMKKDSTNMKKDQKMDKKETKKMDNMKM